MTAAHPLDAAISPTTSGIVQSDLEAEGGAVLVALRKVKLDDGTEVQAGTIEDAARLCTSPERPDGITVATYRAYQRPAKSPIPGWPAPGPFTVTDPATGEEVLARDPTGQTLRNLDEVRRWNAARVGKRGRYPDRDTPETLRRTELRHALLNAAAAGRLGITPLEQLDLPGRTIETRRQAARVSQAVIELAQIGLIEREADDLPYSLTSAGRQVLERFADEAEHL